MGPRDGYDALQALVALLGLLGLLLCAGRWRGDGLPARADLPTERAHPAGALQGRAAFAALHVAIGVWTLGFGGSLSFLLSSFWPLLAAAHAAVLVLALVLVRPARAQDLRASLGLLLLGREAQPALAGLPVKILVKEFSLLLFGLLNVAFVYAQFDLYGLVATPMAAYALAWWLYLASHFAREETTLARWEMYGERLGLVALWRHLVFVPFVLSLPGWALIDHVYDQPRSAMLAPALVLGTSLFVLRSAESQRWRALLDPTTRIWGQPAEWVGNRFLLSGWWRLARQIPDTATFVILCCVARGTGVPTRMVYAIPLLYLIDAVVRILREERYQQRSDPAAWHAYRDACRYRMFPFIF